MVYLNIEIMLLPDCDTTYCARCCTSNHLFKFIQCVNQSKPSHSCFVINVCIGLFYIDLYTCMFAEICLARDRR